MWNNLLVLGNSWIYQVGNQYYGYPQLYFYHLYFKKYFQTINIIAPVKQSQTPKGLPMETFRAIPLPFFNGTLDLLKKCYILPYIAYQCLKNIPKTDVVFISTSDPSATLGLLFSSMFGKPTALFVSEDWEKDIIEKFPRKIFQFIFISVIRLLRYFQFRLLKNKGLIFVTNRSLLSKYNKIPCPVYPCFLSLISEQDISFKTQRQIHEGEVIRILYVGFLIHGKGVQDLIEAVSILYENGFPYCFRLDIVGDGDYRKDLERLVEEKNLKRVYFHGFVGDRSDMKKLYLESDIFVLPSRTEGIPKVLFEAMAYGTAIIATHVGGVPSVICNRYNGLTVPPRDPYALAEAISKLIVDNDLRLNLIANGYDCIKRYTGEIAAEQMYEVLKNEFCLDRN